MSPMDLVNVAIAQANEQWGPGRELSAEVWLAVLVEEVGEVARAALTRDYPQMEDELAQVAAVCIRWMGARR